MRRIISKLIICFSVTAVKLAAIPVVPGVSGCLDYGPGYRVDNLEFSIQDPTLFPDGLSELKWEELQTFMVSARGHITAWDHVYLRGYADWGWILRGDNKAKDFSDSNKTNEFSSFDSTANNGNMADLSMGIGVNLAPWNSGFEIAPLVGYSFHQQQVIVQDSIQRLALDPLFVGPVEGVKAHYMSRWDGPWLGMDVSCHPTCEWKIDASAEYHWCRFRGRGHWERFDCTTGYDFDNKFYQDAHGAGAFFTLGTSYELSDYWGFGLLATFQRFKTKPGRHESDVCDSVNTFPADEQYVGTFPIVEPTILNPVIWNSFSITFELHGAF